MEIKDVKQINKGALKLSFSVTTQGITIRDCKLMGGKNGDWISFPSREYTDAEGKKKYYSYILIDENRKNEFNTKCLDLLQIHLVPDMKTNQSSNDDVPF